MLHIVYFVCSVECIVYTICNLLYSRHYVRIILYNISPAYTIYYV